MNQFGPYSQKVIEHFEHPRNMGEIKNPSGVGMVGNPLCLPPDNLVHLNNNLLKIGLIRKNMKVLGHDGAFHRVKKVFRREYKGYLYKIRVGNLGEVQITPEHLIYGLKIASWPHKFKAAQRQMLDWYQADELEKGDFLAFPILKEKVKAKNWKIEGPRSRWDFKSKRLPGEVKIDSCLLKLIGFYLAEGYVRTERSKGTLGFVFGQDEELFIKEIIKIMKKKFGLKPGKIWRKNNSLHLPFYNALLARIFREEFGKGACGKKMPQWLISLPPLAQKPLLYGLWHGDGYLNNNLAKYVTISEKLAHQLKILLMRQKIIFSFLTSPAKGSHKRHYSIYLKNQDSLIKMAEILGLKFKPIKRKKYPKKSWYDNNYYYLPIKKIQKIRYEGEVYNLEVEKAHSYTTSASSLHNCGDIMKLFIKVGKRKKGSKEEEIIEDIKFKTLGCAAAIATSSMITELAKGKTLEKALKISREDVGDALEGLPPIKMHCSNLAAEALHKAIEDYQKKKDDELA